MEKKFSSVLGIGLALLSVSGFMKSKKPKRLLGLMNVDTQHSVLRVPITLALLYAGSQQSSLKNTRTALTCIGMLYLAIGAAGSLDKSVGGKLPSRLTNFDLVYHFGVGSYLLWLGGRSGRMVKP